MDFITNIDNGIITVMQNNVQNSIFDRIMPIITSLGGMMLWLVIAGIFICTKKYRKYGVILIISLGVCVIFGTGIKEIVKRVRPCNFYDTLNLIISKPTGYSFPSGHSMRSFAAATILFIVDKKFGIPALILAFLTAFSRVYLYAHFFTDLFCGAIFGIVFALATYKILMNNKKVNELLNKVCPILWN